MLNYARPWAIIFSLWCNERTAQEKWAAWKMVCHLADARLKMHDSWSIFRKASSAYRWLAARERALYVYTHPFAAAAARYSNWVSRCVARARKSWLSQHRMETPSAAADINTWSAIMNFISGAFAAHTEKPAAAAEWSGGVCVSEHASPRLISSSILTPGY